MKLLIVDIFNHGLLYLMAFMIILFIMLVCVVFIVKSYKAGVYLGMDKVKLKRAIVSSFSFTLLPSISILLGVVALSGSLGVPLSALRLSVIGSLQYELNVAEIAASGLGMSGLNIAEMTLSNFSTIALVMTTGILGGVVASVLFNKSYQKKLKSKKKENVSSSKNSFSNQLMVAMFIGLCGAYIGSYFGILVNFNNFMPIFVAVVSAVVMFVFEYLINKKKLAYLENFSLATSMLIAMSIAVLVSL